MNQVYNLGRSSQDGFSLLETLIAVAILGFVGVIVVAGVFVSLQSNLKERTRISAESLARFELEYTRAVISENWTLVPSTGTSPTTWYILPGTPPSWNASHSSLPQGYTNYSIQIQGNKLSSYPYSSNPNIYQVSATVSYNGIQVLQIATYMTKMQ